jgi:hypothetical protein
VPIAEQVQFLTHEECFRSLPIRLLQLACVLECGGAPPLSVAADENQNVCGLDPRSKLLFLPSGIGFKAHPQKRQDTAALQNLAVILRPFLAEAALR